MSIFDGLRLNNDTVKLDVAGLRRGFYSDKYFENVVKVLEAAQASGYTFAGNSPRLPEADAAQVAVGDIEVEAQYFNRRSPYTLVAGVDVALLMVRHAAGYFADGEFIETWRQLAVEAVEDGAIAAYGGDSMQVRPVMRIRGRYRDFALLETTMLGVMARATRIATNVYDLLQVCNGKTVLFFPARFDVPEVQMLDGYAYWLAVQRYNRDFGQSVRPVASTDAQSAWWGGRGSGTIPHALVACFLGDTAEAMVTYARYLPLDAPRIALVDFNNDTIGASLATASAFWQEYRAAHDANDEEGKRRWMLEGVRLDTSKNVRDVSLEPDGEYGVNPQLVRLVRDALDNAWQSWNVPAHLADVAQRYCRGIKIVVTGGFDRQRIQEYETAGIPVDTYGVGSRFLQNDARTNADYSMDVVRVRVGDEWVEMAKVGRQPNDNPDLQPVDLSSME